MPLLALRQGIPSSLPANMVNDTIRLKNNLFIDKDLVLKNNQSQRIKIKTNSYALINIYKNTEVVFDSVEFIPDKMPCVLSTMENWCCAMLMQISWVWLTCHISTISEAS